MALQSTTALATITLQAATNQVVFSSIPNIYRDLILVFSGSGTGNTELKLRYNSDSGSNYPYVAVDNTYNEAGTANSAFNFMYLTTSQWLHISHIIDYSATDKHKTTLSRRNMATQPSVAMEANRWTNTAAINNVSITATSANIASGTTISLYGRIA